MRANQPMTALCTALLTLLALALPTAASEPDSTASADALLRRVEALEAELALVRATRDDPPEAEVKPAPLPEDTRSRRRWVESVLKALRDRPGRIRFNGGATGILQVQEESDDAFGTATGSFDLFIHTRLGENTLFFVDLEAVGGNGPGQSLPSLTALNGDAGSTQGAGGFDRTHVLEAWVELAFAEETLKVTAGKIDVTNYFDVNAVANDETSQFITGAFGNSAALPAPDNGPGVRLKADLGARGAFQVAVASHDASGHRIFEDLFLIGSAGLVAGGPGRPANLRVYGYLNGAVDNATGFGISADAAVADGLALFGRWNRNTRDLAASAGVTAAWSLGAEYTTSNDLGDLTAAAAFGVIDPHTPGLSNERLAEFYVRQQLNRWTSVSPHLQVVDNAAGGDDRHILLGLRTQFDF